MNDGEEFCFSYRDFQTMDENIRGSITGMYQVKMSFDPSIITIDGQENVADVARDMHLNQQEKELLYLLFDVGEPLRQSTPWSGILPQYMPKYKNADTHLGNGVLFAHR